MAVASEPRNAGSAFARNNNQRGWVTTAQTGLTAESWTACRKTAQRITNRMRAWHMLEVRAHELESMNGVHPMPTGLAPQPLLAAGERVTALKESIEAGLVGCSALVERLLIALLTGGHVLLEGAPGLAKTRAVKRLAAGLDVSFARVQCTPDLMPADITGTPVWRPDRGIFEFVAGPIFHSVVLVDEINRAPPKVQSALLEAMAEQQVTAGGLTHKLAMPFMVVATQNPIEHEGTFPLPEAQLDRFLLQVVIGLPTAPVERQILDLVEQETLEHGTQLSTQLSIAEMRPHADKRYGSISRPR